MLTVTEQAAAMMTEALKIEEKQDHGLRLVAQSGCCSGPSYGLFPEESNRPDDTVISEGDLKLFIDPTSMALLQGATIDFVNDPEMGQGFTIKNPNIETALGGGCGCNSHEAEAAEAAENTCSCGGECGCGAH